MRTKIPKDMIEAYLNTDFRVEDNVLFILKIGVQNRTLMNLHVEAGCDCSAYITAWNPYSEEQSNEENEKFQAYLLEQLSHSTFKTLKGMGQDPLEKWPGEPSLLVLGMSKVQASAVGNQFKQNAIVWMGPEAIPELVLLR